jgi:hypothetical protein
MPEGYEEADFEQVAEALRQRGFEAEVHASGGGIDVVRVAQGDHVFYFGTAAEVWGASVYAGPAATGGEDEEHVGETWTQASSDNTDPAMVADAIASAVTEYER